MAYKQSFPMSNLPINGEQENDNATNQSRQPSPNITQPLPPLPNINIAGIPQNIPAPIYAQPRQASPRPSFQHVRINVPGGLECLTQMDYLRIKQGVKGIEALTRHESNYKYGIADIRGNYFFGAKEFTEYTCRLCCTPELHMKIKDLDGNEVIHMYMPMVCYSCCVPPCLQNIQVYAPAGQLVGTVEQKRGLCFPKLLAKNVDGNVVLGIKGPLFKTSFFSNSVKFDILTQDGSTPIGNISKSGTSFFKDCGTGIYEARLPINLDVKMKAVLLGAVFLIDFLYFDQDKSCCVARTYLKGTIFAFCFYLVFVGVVGLFNT